MKFQVDDIVKVVNDASSRHGMKAMIIEGRDKHGEYGLGFPGVSGPLYFGENELEMVTPSPVKSHEQSGIDRLNAEADCYRKEAQEARALQRKFYDESVELRKQLAQVTAERDAANQQCACAVSRLDDLRACLKALAR